MKRKWANIALAMSTAWFLAACAAGGAPFDPRAVEMTLEFSAETVEAGSEVELRAVFEGVELSDEAEVTYDFRSGDKPELKDAVYDGSGFTTVYTFPEKGIQTFYVHLYQGDIHLTKKKLVEVR